MKRAMTYAKDLVWYGSAQVTKLMDISCNQGLHIINTAIVWCQTLTQAYDHPISEAKAADWRYK